MSQRNERNDVKINTVGLKTTVDSLVMDQIILQLKQLLAGALSGGCTRFLTQPLDVLKIRFQLQVEPLGRTASHASKYKSMTQALKIIYKEEGVRGLWVGHNAGQVMTVTYAMTQFWSYERVVGPIKSAPFFKNHLYVAEFVAGGISGIVGSVVSLPFDVVRTRFVAQDPGSGYKNMLNGLYTLMRNEGMRGCFRGLVPTVVQIVPMMGGNFMFYHMLNDISRKLLKQPTGHLPTWSNLLSGALAGTMAKTITYPFDFLKKRVQMQGFESNRKKFGKNQGCNNLRGCISTTLREEGLLGFYKGLSPTLLKGGAASAFFFAFYDLFKNLMNI